MRRSVRPERLTMTGWRRRRCNVCACGYFDERVVDVIRVLQLRVEVETPSGVYGGERNPAGAKLIGQIEFCTLKSERVVSEDNPASAHENDQQNGREWQPGLHSLLIQADQNDHCWTEQTDGVTVVYEL